MSAGATGFGAEANTLVDEPQKDETDVSNRQQESQQEPKEKPKQELTQGNVQLTPTLGQTGPESGQGDEAPTPAAAPSGETPDDSANSTSQVAASDAAEQ